MTKQQLATKIWAAANKMRSKISADKYKDYILGFIFYKFLSEKQVEHFKKNGATDEDIREIVESADFKDEINESKNDIGYFIAYDNLYTTWISKGLDFNIKDVRDALSAFNRNIGDDFKSVYKGIFDTLETGLSRLGDNAVAQTKAVRDILKLIKDIPVSGDEGYDVLGYVYEYLIGAFAANAGKKGGEYYTPYEVSALCSIAISWHLRNDKEIKIYDPCSGSGSLLLHIGNCIEKYNNDKNCVKYYAQELNTDTYNLTRMNLILRGVQPGNIVTRNGDSLDKDWPWFDDSDPEHTYDPLVNISAVAMNPPYSQQWDPSTHETDARFMHYGLAPKSKADFAFLLHGFYHLKDGGIQTIVLPHGVLFRGGEEAEIRKNLLENNQIDTIIGLPANIFYGTGIPTIVMFLKKGRPERDILFIDASKGFVKEGTKNKLRDRDIKKIFDTYVGRLDIPGFSRKVSLEEIRSNDYNLNIPRYIDAGDEAEQIDIYASMFGGIPRIEIEKNCGKELEAFPSLSADLFEQNDTPYTSLKVANVHEAVSNNRDVESFLKKYKEEFSAFEGFMEGQLLDGSTEKNRDAIEEAISNEIFLHLGNIPLVDKYEAYQTFSDLWKTISADLEIIKTDGWNAVKTVDPNMVPVKAQNGNEDDVNSEVQDGWKGRILPFDLVQKELMKNQLSAIADIGSQIDSVVSAYSEKINDLSEEERDSFVIEGEETRYAVNEDGTPDTKTIKEILRPYTGRNARPVIAGSAIAKLMEIKGLLDEEGSLKKQQKGLIVELNNSTKGVIENLTDEEQQTLLKIKWIKPLLDEIDSLPVASVDNLIDKIEKLNKKYSNTLVDTEAEIKKAESELIGMLNGLTGNAYDMKGIEAFKKLLRGN